MKKPKLPTLEQRLESLNAELERAKRHYDKLTISVRWWRTVPLQPDKSIRRGDASHHSTRNTVEYRTPDPRAERKLLTAAKRLDYLRALQAHLWAERTKEFIAQGYEFYPTPNRRENQNPEPVSSPD